MRKRLKRVDCTWSPDLAYAVGLIASDGNLSSDGRHINLTSKDYEMFESFKRILKLTCTIGKKARGGEAVKKYYVCQFSDVNFYEFLLSIGLTPAKSKTMGALCIPDSYFADFFRGCIDGDGSIGGFHHPESKYIQIRLSLCSASEKFIHWVHTKLRELYEIEGGYYSNDTKKSVLILRFGSSDSLKLFKIMYYANSVPALSRKRKIAEELTEGRVAKLV